MSAATGILTAWPTSPSVSPSRKIMSMSLSTACARSCPARHTALLVPLRRGRRPRRPALPRSLCPSVGATLAVARGRGRAPPLCTPRNAPSRADRVVRPYKITPCRAGPMCPAAHRTPCKKCHCETSANAGRGNPYPPSKSLPCVRGGDAKRRKGRQPPRLLFRTRRAGGSPPCHIK